MNLSIQERNKSVKNLGFSYRTQKIQKLDGKLD